VKIILTVDVPDRGDLGQDTLDCFIEHSTLRECLETAFDANVTIKGDVSTSQNYLGNDDGRCCPHCGGLAESSGEMVYDACTAWQDCLCPVCGESWRDEYRLIGFQPFMKFVRVAPEVLKKHGFTEVANQNGEGDVILRNVEGDLMVYKVHDGFSGQMIPTEDGRVLEFFRSL